MTVGIRFEARNGDGEFSASKDLGPFEYAELTYRTLRVNDGEPVAEFHENRWVVSCDHRTHAVLRNATLSTDLQKLNDTKWTDVVIYSWS